jgi:TonB family protein
VRLSLPGFAVTGWAVLLWSSVAWGAPVIAPPQRTDSTPVAYPQDGKGDASVVLALVIDSDGVVTEAVVVRGEPPFAEAALDAVKAWHFLPATRDGAPTPSRITATVEFHAPAPPPPSPSPPSVPPPPAPEAGPTSAPDVVDVEVRGEREELDTNHIPRTETRFIPGAFGDPFRAIEALPGMAPWLSGLPYYYVRGSPPENVGYFIDGIRVPLLFHVGAGPSILAPALVDSVDLHPGAYPARYGRYAGAVIAGETTPPQMDRVHAEFDVRVFDADAYGEAPFDDGRGSAMVAGRYGYTGFLTSLIAPDYTVAYWDYQARVAHRTWGDDVVSLFVFGAHDELAFLKQPIFRIDYQRADLRYDHPWHEGRLRIAATFTTDDTLTALQTDTGAGAGAALHGPGGRIRAELEQRVDPRALVRAGADFGATRFDTDRFDTTVYAPHTDFEGGFYSDVVWRPRHDVEVVPGVRLDGFEARGSTGLAPQPRLAARIRIFPHVSWISAFGTAHQEATEEVFVPAKLPDPIDEAPRDSYHFSEALETRLPSSMTMRGTVFYSRLIAPSVGGQEQSKGFEVFLRRDFTRRLGGFLAYTLSRTETTQGAAIVRAPSDRTHLVSVVLGYDLGRGWRIGGRFFFESGRPYLEQCPTPGCAPGGRLPVGVGPYTASGTLPPFYRLDMRLEKRWNFSSGSWLAWTLECFDVFDKAEPIGERYDPTRGLVLDTQSPIILPSIGIEGGI